MTPYEEYLALLNAMKDYPDEPVDRTLAIQRYRERQALTWREIGAMFTLSAERARQIGLNLR